MLDINMLNSSWHICILTNFQSIFVSLLREEEIQVVHSAGHYQIALNLTVCKRGETKDEFVHRLTGKSFVDS